MIRHFGLSPAFYYHSVAMAGPVHSETALVQNNTILVLILNITFANWLWFCHLQAFWLSMTTGKSLLIRFGEIVGKIMGWVWQCDVIDDWQFYLAPSFPLSLRKNTTGGKIPHLRRAIGLVVNTRFIRNICFQYKWQTETCTINFLQLFTKRFFKTWNQETSSIYHQHLWSRITEKHRARTHTHTDAQRVERKQKEKKNYYF